MVYAFLVVALAGAAACGSDSQPPEDARDTGRPPSDFEALADLFNPRLEPAGLRVARAALVDRTGGGYDSAPAGNHLAIYVEPIGPYSMADYVSGIASVTALFVPDVFERWTELDSLGLCQEGVEAPGESTSTTVVAIELTRAGAEALDWGEVQTEDVLRAAVAQPEDIRVLPSAEVLESSEFRQARSFG